MENLYNNIINKIKSFICSFSFSFVVSWKASKGRFSIRILLQIILALSPMANAYISRGIINLLAGSLSKKMEYNILLSQFIWLLFLFIIVGLAASMVNKFNETVSGIHQDLIGNYISRQMMKKTASLDIAYFDSPDFYNEIANAKRDSQSLQTLTWFTVSFINSFVQIILSAFILVKLHWVFPILLILLNIPYIVSEKRFTKYIYGWQRKRVPEERKMGYLQAIITDRGYAKDLRLFGLFDEMFDRYLALWEKWFGEKTSITYKRSLGAIICTSFPYFGVASASYYTGTRILKGLFSIGDFTFYLSLVTQLNSSVNNLVNNITKIYDNELRISNYRKFLDMKPNIIHNGKLKVEGVPFIEFKNVTFKYQNTDRYIVQNLSFSIYQGEKIALVGLNGAGKTTVVKLLLRFYEPVEGKITINGIDVRQYDIEEYRRIFGVVFQDFTNYAFTLRENIAISDLGAANNDTRIMAACDASGVSTMIKKWKNGLDSYVTKQFEEDGEVLSGGEGQKLAIARAFFRNSGLMVLDEPTASLDPESEHRIYEQFVQLCRGKSALFISHRLSSVTMADRILVLENGNILESGTHEELLRINGRYAYLFNLQAEKYIRKSS